MSSWLFALFASSQVPYELLALVELMHVLFGLTANLKKNCILICLAK